jgi:DNA-3-methyladenine glycosylase II
MPGSSPGTTTSERRTDIMPYQLKTQADLDAAIAALLRQDSRLEPILHIAGMPALRQREPGFAGLAAIVCGQQVSVASATAIWGRVRAAFEPFDPAALRRARAERLGRLGLSAAKIKTLKALAKELAAERLDLDALAEQDADAAHARLTALHGIGPWTADIYLLFCLGHGDLGRAMAAAARRRRASVVELLSRAQAPRRRDRRCADRACRGADQIRPLNLVAIDHSKRQNVISAMPSRAGDCALPC